MNIVRDPISVSINYARINEHLRKLRLQKRLKQAEVAEIINVQTGTFGNMERSQQKLNLQHIIELCVLYGVQPGDVLNDCCDELIAMGQPASMAENPDKIALYILISKCSDKTLKVLHALAQSLFDCMEKKY